MRIRISIFPEDFPEAPANKEFRLEKQIGNLELAYAKDPPAMVQATMQRMTEKIIEEMFKNG